jgi:hypothetical protein
VILEEDVEASLSAAEARGDAGFLARDGFHGSLDSHPGEAKLHVGDIAVVFGRVEGEIEAADDAAVGMVVEVVEQDALARVIEDAGADAKEAAGEDAADG